MTTQSQAAKPPVTRFDAVIVGAGMVGAALAGLLAEAGMQVALVEAKASPLRLDDVAGEIPAPRVSALTPVSQRLNSVRAELERWAVDLRSEAKRMDMTATPVK